MASKTSSAIDAVKAIYEALEPLDEPTRDRAIASAMSLLGMTTRPVETPRATGQQVTQAPAQVAPAVARSDRPMGLVELMQEKQPATNPQRIAIFAFYREREEGLPRFGRHDLEQYFPTARVPKPGNYDRDFNSAVQQGWIHEAGSESYLTTKGIEAVEAGFAGKRAARTKAAAKSSVKKASSRKKAATKRPTKTKVPTRRTRAKTTGR